jgi:hypothetical protein
MFPLNDGRAESEEHRQACIKLDHCHRAADGN